MKMVLKKFSQMSLEEKRQVRKELKAKKKAKKAQALVKSCSSSNKSMRSRNRSRAESLASKPEEAPVARNVRVVAKQQRGLLVSGSDRILFVEDISTVKARTIIAAVPVVPGLFPRLKRIAGAFHRIRYLSLVFEVVPQMGTATSGGYLLSFVKDVTEDIENGERGLATLFAQSGCVAASDWQPATLKVANFPDLYYCEWDKAEPRWSSPGKICFATDGAASQKGSVTVYCHWRVRVVEPESEPLAKAETEVEVGYDIGMKAGTKNLGVGSNYQFDHDADKFAKALPGVEKSTYLELPDKAYYLKNESNEIAGIVAFRYMLYKSDGYLLPVDDSFNEITSLTYGNVLCVAKGTIVSIVKDNRSLNFLRGSKYICQPNIFEPSDNLPRLSERKESPAGSSNISTCIKNPFSKGWMKLLKPYLMQDLSESTHFSELQEQLNLLCRDHSLEKSQLFEPLLRFLARDYCVSSFKSFKDLEDLAFLVRLRPVFSSGSESEYSCLD
uniref:Capsid protein n=1 Tax=Macrotermes subhyalinus permutotetra-like virus 1 TaxID=3133506 RepID=A0AAT9JF83_9VIRU